MYQIGSPRPVVPSPIQLHSPQELTHNLSSPAAFPQYVRPSPSNSQLHVNQRIPDSLTRTLAYGAPPIPTTVAVQRRPVQMQLELVEDMIQQRRLPAVRDKPTDLELRRIVNGPRFIAEPWEIVRIGGDSGFDIQTPEMQNVVLHYYISDTLPRSADYWTRPSYDKEKEEAMNIPINVYRHWKHMLDKGMHWHSIFPGPIRAPSAINNLELVFSLPGEVMSLAEFVTKLTTGHSPGVLALEMTDKALQRALEGKTKQILVDAIEVAQVHSSLPISVNLQLFSHALARPPSSRVEQPVTQTGGRLSIGDVAWFPRNSPNMHVAESQAISQSTNPAHKNADPHHDTLSCCILPNTNTCQKRLVYGISAYSRQPMFQRWIHVSEEAVWREAAEYDATQTLGEYYRVPCLNNSHLKTDTRDVPDGKYIQFMCLDEWEGMKAWAVQNDLPLPRIESDLTFSQKLWDTYDTEKPGEITGDENDTLYFFVPHRVLHHFIRQKFSDDTDKVPQWQMSKDRYFMRVDQPITLALNIAHTYPRTFADEHLAKYEKANPSAWVSFHCVLRVHYEDPCE